MPDENQSIAKLMELLREGSQHLVEMAKELAIPWNPDLKNPRALHNMYARNLITSYVSKFADLSAGVILAIEQENFLTYALCGRALIETTAILRYYIIEQYKPLFDKGQFGKSEMQQLIDIDDHHLRGGKFDWESFLSQRYSKLKKATVEKLDRKGDPNPESCTSRDWRYRRQLRPSKNKRGGSTCRRRGTRKNRLLAR
jgi:hypothetical protein